MSFRKSVLDFMEAQLKINNARHDVADAHQRTLAAMSRRIDLLERQVEELTARQHR